MMPSRKTLIMGAIIAGAVPVLDALARLDVTSLPEPRMFAIGLAVAFIRQVAIYVGAQIALWRG